MISELLVFFAVNFASVASSGVYSGGGSPLSPPCRGHPSGLVVISGGLVEFSGGLVVISCFLVVCSGRPFCFKAKYQSYADFRF